jgi:hypothetical protein
VVIVSLPLLITAIRFVLGVLVELVTCALISWTGPLCTAVTPAR